MISRIIEHPLHRTKKSILLLGPRQVGKSTLIQSLNPDLTINLMNELELMTHSSRPDELNGLIRLSRARSVFVDEVQRLPQLLNTIQTLIDGDKKLKFYLTGSSARKLRRGGANLLPGRVLNYKIGPLVAAELEYQAQTERLLTTGSLPEVYLSQSEKDAQKLISSYAANYLKEEIKAEALTRSLESFARFLQESVLSVAQFVDLSKIAKQARISRHIVPRYFEILEDTLVGYRVYSFEPLRKQCDLIRHPKFFLFDNGVFNALIGNFIASRDRIGVLAEQLVFSQILHSSWAKDVDASLASFRTRKGIEVDFILTAGGKHFGIEVKSSDSIGTEDFAGLEFLSQQSVTMAGYFILHLGKREQKFGQFWSLPWQKGLKELGL